MSLPRFAGRTAFLALALGFASVTACGDDAKDELTPSGDDSDDDDVSDDDDDIKDDRDLPDTGPPAELTLLNDTVYTGVDGTHTFVVPVGVYKADTDLTLTVSDPAAATVAAATRSDDNSGDGQYFLVTAKKAGTYTLTAKSKGRTATIALEIESYAPSLYAAGEARYTNGYVADATGGKKCTDCHGPTKRDHSPAAIGPLSDAEVTGIITTGVKNGGIPVNGGNHKWTVDPANEEATYEGLVVYLRSLPPNKFTPR